MATTIKSVEGKGKAATSAKKAAAKAALAAAKAKATAARAASKAASETPAAPAKGKRKPVNGGKPAGTPAPVGKTGTQASGGRDGWGAGLGTGTAVLNGFIASQKGDFSSKAAGEYSAANGGRAAIGSHLNCLRLRGIIVLAGRGIWRVTPAGAALWGNKPLPKGAAILPQAVALGTAKPKGDDSK